MTERPVGVIYKIDRTHRWGTLYHVVFLKDSTLSTPNTFRFKKHQLEVISEGG